MENITPTSSASGTEENFTPTSWHYDVQLHQMNHGGTPIHIAAHQEGHEADQNQEGKELHKEPSRKLCAGDDDDGGGKLEHIMHHSSGEESLANEDCRGRGLPLCELNEKIREKPMGSQTEANEAIRELMSGSESTSRTRGDRSPVTFVAVTPLQPSIVSRQQVPKLTILSPKLREIQIMASECTRDGEKEANELGRVLRVRGFQSSLKQTNVPPLKLGLARAPRVTTFHELFANSARSTANSQPNSRPSTRGLLSRGKVLSRTPWSSNPCTTKKIIVTTDRAQTSPETAREYVWAGLDGDLLSAKPMTGERRKNFPNPSPYTSEQHAPKFTENSGLSPRPDNFDLFDGGANIDLLRTRLNDNFDDWGGADLRQPTIICMKSPRGSVGNSFDCLKLDGETRIARKRSPREKGMPFKDHISHLLFGGQGYQNPYGNDIRSTEARTSFADAAAVGSASSGLFSVVLPRERNWTLTPRTPRSLRHTVSDPSFNAVGLSPSNALTNTLTARKLETATVLVERERASQLEFCRQQHYRRLVSDLEKQARNIWKPKMLPHAIEEVTSTNAKALQKLAMIRRFCELSSPDNNDELMTLYYRFMSRSEGDDEEEVQGFVKLLVTVGALKMRTVTNNQREREKSATDMLEHVVSNDPHVLVEDGILTSTAEIHREEVFEVFNTISFLFDTQEKPFSFEVVKYFMGKITERVLAKLQGELASLKAEALNPVSIRASQAANNGTTASLLIGESARNIGRSAGRNSNGGRLPVPGSLFGGQLRKTSARGWPTQHVTDAKLLHSAQTPRLCEDVPVRLYCG